VLICGEPGIGKSRLAAALAERLRDEPHLRLRYFCSPYHQDSALYPFIDQLGRAAGFARDDPPAARGEKLEALLALATPPEGGRDANRRSTVIAAFGTRSAPERQSSTEKRKNTGGADPPARSPGAPAAGVDCVRGRALDRPDFARIARPHGRAGAQSA